MLSTPCATGSVCARIAQRLEDSVGPRKYKMWFGRSAHLAYSEAGHRLAVSVPNRFLANWIGRNFEPQLSLAASEEAGHPVELDIRVEPGLFGQDGEGAGAAVAAEGEPVKGPAVSPPVAAAAAGETQRRFRHRLEDFVVGPSNELAYAAAHGLVSDEHSLTSPLVIHGACGLGKTHLLQGICSMMLNARPGGRVLYQSGEQFTNAFLAAVRTNKLDAFRRRIRRLDLLAIDDVHFLANKPATQREFLHSFDAIELGGARVVLASDSHPRHIPQFSEALVSRCVRGMVVQVHPPDGETRGRIIHALAGRRGLMLTDPVVADLADRCVGAVRDIEGTLTRLHALASLQGDRPHGDRGVVISRGLVQRLFDHDPAQRPRQAVRFETILDTVVDELSVDRAQLLGSGRQKDAVLARALVIHLARQMTPMSYPEIAAAMGRRSHSTVITAAKRIERQIEENPALLLRSSLQAVPLKELLQKLRNAIARG